MLVRRHPVDNGGARRTAVRHHADIEDVSIRAEDDTVLKGWLFTPLKWNHRSVLLVHGGSCSARMGMLPQAEWFLDSGYASLVVDLRGCGNSGGEKSYGLKEPSDMAAWVKWLHDRTQSEAVFAHGASRGGTVLIQSLALRPALDGLVAQSAGTGNLAHPYQLIGEYVNVSERTAKWIASPLIEPSFAWVRWKHGLDFRRITSGLTAIHQTRTPVLLIHGTADEVTPYRGAQRLRDANPEYVELWTIPGADHDLYRTHSQEMKQRMLAWVESVH